MEELIQEALHQITGEPWIFTIEIVQFIMLVLIIRFLLPRIVGTTLKERRNRIAADVEKADQVDAAYAKAQQQTAALVAAARADALRTIEIAKTTAQEERRAGLDRAEQEANAIILQARQAVETEKERVVREASEQLVSLITLVIRRFIEESLTESERRAVTQKLILASLNEMEGTSSRQ
jgi:F0F1-type ATP synthase membrane subunit b/b'